MSLLNGTSDRDWSGVVTMYRGHRGTIERFFWGSTGESIISCDVTGGVNTWNARSGVTLATYVCSEEAACDIALSFDGKAMAVCDDNGIIRVWDVARGELLTAYSGHQEVPLSVSWSPDSTRIVSVQRNAAHIWYVWEQARLSQVLSFGALLQVSGPAFQREIERELELAEVD